MAGSGTYDMALSLDEVGVEVKDRPDADIVSIREGAEDDDAYSSEEEEEEDDGAEDTSKGILYQRSKSHSTEKRSYRFYLFIPEKYSKTTKIKIYLKVPHKRTVKKRLKPVQWFERLWVTNEIQIRENVVPILKYRYALQSAAGKFKEEKTRPLRTPKQPNEVEYTWSNFGGEKKTECDSALSPILQELVMDKKKDSMYNLPEIAKPLKVLREKSTAFHKILASITVQDSLPVEIADKLALVLLLNTKTKDRGVKFLEKFKSFRDRKDMYIPNFFGLLNNLLTFNQWELSDLLEIHAITSRIPNLSDKYTQTYIETNFIEPLLIKKTYDDPETLIDVIQSVLPVLERLQKAVKHFERQTIEALDKESGEKLGIFVALILNTQYLFETRQTIEIVLQRLRGTHKQCLLEITQLVIDSEKVQRVISQNELKEYLYLWIKNATNRFEENALEKYYLYYSYIEKTNVMQSLSDEDKKKIQEVLLLRVKEFCKVFEILEVSEKIQRGNDLFYSHAREVVRYRMASIQASTQPLMLFFDGAFGCVGNKPSYSYKVKRRETALIIVELLGRVTDHVQSDVLQLETIQFYVSNHAFWKWILVIDQQVGVIKPSSPMRKVLNFAAEMVQNIKNQTLWCHVVLEIGESGQSRKLVDFLADLTKAAQTFIEELWQGNLEKLKEYENDINKTEQMVTFLKQFENMPNQDGQYMHIRDTENIQQRLKCLKENLTSQDSKVPLCKVSTVDFWSQGETNIEYIYEIAKERYRECSFISFVSYVKKHRGKLTIIRQEDILVDENTQQALASTGSTEYQETSILRPNVHYATLSDVAKAVWEIEYKEFTNLLINLFYRKEDVSIRLVTDIFEDIFDIKQEMDRLKLCFPNIASKPRKALEMWRDRVHLKDFYASIQNLCRTFNVPFQQTSSNSALTFLHDMLKGERLQKMTLWQFYDKLAAARMEVGRVSEVHQQLICALGKAQKLIIFLKQVVDEYLPQMLTAVGQYSDEFINQDTVRALIAVNATLKPVFRKMAKGSTVRCSDLVAHIVDLQIQPSFCDNVHLCAKHASALENLRMNLTDRKEAEKERVKQLLRECVVSIKGEQDNIIVIFTNNGSPHLKRSKHSSTSLERETSESQTLTMDYEEALQLKTKVLLLLNTTAKNTDEARTAEEDTETSHSFIKLMDNLSEVMGQLSSLQREGHLDFQTFELDFSPEQLLVADECGNCEALEKYRVLLNAWKNDLKDARSMYKHLNYIYGRQIKVMVDFFKSSKSKQEAEAIIQFIFPKLWQRATSYTSSIWAPSLSVRDQLVCLGKSLAEFETMVLGKFSQQHHITPTKDIPDKYLHKTLIVTIPKSGSTVDNIPQVILELYRTMQEGAPQASKIVFCANETHPEEIYLILERCFSCEEAYPPLHCIVNAELLSTSTKESLVQFLEEKQQKRDSKFSLALICQTEPSDHFIEKLEKLPKTVRIGGRELQKTSQTAVCSYGDIPVITVTSECPGQGKSAFIERFAAQQNLRTKVIHIEGEINRKTIIKDMLKLGNLKYHLLHIDIKPNSNTAELDKVLFQLISLGNLSYRGQHAVCPGSAIAIEIANTTQNRLQDMLSYATSFKREHIRWQNFENYITPCEPKSDVQIVAKYLDSARCQKLNHLNVDISENTKVLRSSEVKILFQHFFGNSLESFSVLKGIIAMLANQFKRFSHSAFFDVSTIRYMVLGRHANIIRSRLFDAIMDQTKAFGPKHINEVCSRHKTPSLAKTNSEELHEAVLTSTDAITRWEDFKHDVLLFNNKDSHTITILCRELENIPPAIKELLQLQSERYPDDPLQLTESKWQSKLDLIAGQWNDTEVQNRLGYLANTYTLTRDNVLKMALILLRLRSKVPVILMGETGCGKTTLIRYLAYISGAQFYVLNLHSGTTREAISEFMEDCLPVAEKSDQNVWLFFDEINTCDHQGFMTEIICHRLFKGRHVPVNMSFLAACNPYKKRDKSTILTAGLDTKASFDEISQLVYRVNPLPVTILDYVWNYGSLTEMEEEKYISKMLHNVFESQSRTCTDAILVKTVCASQNFLRRIEKSPWCVSLRDVQRCKTFMVWFHKMLVHKSNFPNGNYTGPKTKDEFYFRALYLALAQCYQVRIAKASRRKEYWEEVSSVIVKESTDIDQKKEKRKAEEIIHEIKEEQMDILCRMDLPTDIAKNSILLENVFVMFVSILTKTPVFVIGKPGCSKSLSMQLLSTNLRGSESEDEFFKTLPMFYVIPYQGSEVSTSEGIQKVFDWAKGHVKEKEPHINWKDEARLRRTSNEGKVDNSPEVSNSVDADIHTVLPVVLLDEIGLAEISPYNPLKVLHSLLETEKGESLDVAVIGISNWALDAAKMNRAVHVSCPDMGEDDLVEIAKCMKQSLDEKHLGVKPKTLLDDELEPLRNLVKAYLKYITGPMFHGARDFYSLTKFIIAKRTKHQSGIVDSKLREIIIDGVQRNFGGLSDWPTRTFLASMGFDNQSERIKVKSLEDLISDNVQDTESRHLMVISKNHSDLSFISRLLDKLGKQFDLMIGSNYKGDTNEAYFSRVLSDVILSMENGNVLVMKDLGKVYTSLYEMLNQSYSVVKSTNKKRCRVALGPYRNPLCEIHENFTCIVLMDEKEIPTTDIPFLNRFEKQLFSFEAILDAYQSTLCEALAAWINDFSSMNDTSSQTTNQGGRFEDSDAFVGYNADTVPSLVFRLCELASNLDVPQSQDTYKLAQDVLMRTTPRDAVLRLAHSKLSITDSKTSELQKEYFTNAVTQDGLEEFMKKICSQKQDCEDKVHRIVVYTHTPYFTHMTEIIGKEVLVDDSTQSVRLGEFNSEKEMDSSIGKFFNNDNTKWLFIRCTPSEDAVHIPLAKSVVDRRIKPSRQQESEKFVCFIVHIDKRIETTSYSLHFSYLDKWEFYTVDQLQAFQKNETHFKTLDILLCDEREAIEKLLDINTLVQQNIEWAFSCIRYREEMADVKIGELITKITSTPEIIAFIAEKVLDIVHKSSEFQENDIFNPSHWQVKLSLHVNVWKGYSLMNVWQKFLENKVKETLAIVISQIQRLCAWESYFTASSEHEKQIWSKLVQDPSVIQFPCDIGKIGYQTIEILSLPVSLKCPFSRVFTEKLKMITLDLSEEMMHLHQEKYQIHEKIKVEANTEQDLAEIANDLDEQEINRIVDNFSGKVSLALEPVRNEVRYMTYFVEDFYADLVASEFPLLPISECSNLCNILFFGFNPKENMDTVRYLTHVLVQYTIHKEEVFAFCQLAAHYKNLSQTYSCLTTTELFRHPDAVLSKENYINGLCCTFIPTTKILGQIKLDQWLSIASSFLSLVAGIDYTGSLVDILKVLRDFTIVFVSSKAMPQFSTALGELGDNIKQVANEETFEIEPKDLLTSILDIQARLSAELNSEHVLLHFLSTYFARIVLGNDEKDLTHNILDFIVKKSMCGRQGLCIGQILEEMLQPLFEDEEEDSLQGVLKLLCQKEEGDEIVDLVGSLNDILEKIEVSTINHPLCLLVIDIFESKLQQGFVDLNEVFDLQSKYKLAFPDLSSKPTIQMCACVAALRLFIETAAKNVQTIIRDPATQKRIDFVMKKSTPDEQNWPLVFFLKCLPCFTMREIEDESRRLTEIQIAAFKDLTFNHTIFYALLYNPLPCLIDQTVREKLSERDIFSASNFKDHCRKKIMGCLYFQAFLVNLAEKYFMPSLVQYQFDPVRLQQELKEFNIFAEDEVFYVLYNEDVASKLKNLVGILISQEIIMKNISPSNIESNNKEKFEILQIAVLKLHVAVAFLPLCTKESMKKIKLSSVLGLLLNGKVMDSQSQNSKQEEKLCQAQFCSNKHFLFGDKCETCPRCKIPVEVNLLDDIRETMSDALTCKYKSIFSIIKEVFLSIIHLVAKETTDFVANKEEHESEQRQMEDCQKELRLQLQGLQKITGLQIEDFYLMMNAMINHFAQDICYLQDDKFDEQLLKFFSNRNTNMRDYRHRILQLNECNTSSIEAQIYEWPDNAETTASYRDCLRTVKRPSVDYLKFELQLLSEDDASLRLAALIIHMETYIQLLKHLYPLLAWMKCTSIALSGLVTKRECAQMKVKRLLDENKSARSSFHFFRDSWNELVKSNETLKVIEPSVPELTRIGYPDNTNLIDCLTGSSRDVTFQIATVLMRIQNMFLLKAFDICSETNSTVTQFLNVNEHLLLPILSLHTARAEDIITAEITEKYLACCEVSVDYGKGSCFNFNRQQLERIVAHDSLKGKSFLVVDLPDKLLIHFKDNAPDPIGKLLALALETCSPQKELTDSLCEDLIDQKNKFKKEDFFENMQDMLGHVLVSMTKERSNPKETLHGYLQKKFSRAIGFAKFICKDTEPDSERETFFKDHTDLLLSHVVALYEFTEEQFAIEAAEALSDSFKLRMSDQSRWDLQEFASVTKISWRDLQKVFLKLLVRHISLERNFHKGMKPTDGLLEVMKDEFLWHPITKRTKEEDESITWPEIEKALPRSWQASEIHSILTYIKEKQADSSCKKPPRALMRQKQKKKLTRM